MAKTFKERSFVQMAVSSALLFFFVVMIIEVIFSFFKDETVSDVLVKYTTAEYVIAKLIGAAVYGLVIAYFYQRKAKKIRENRK